MLLEEDVACPICLRDLFTNRESVGALTYQGTRIEHELYHMGCVTRMFCHTGNSPAKASSAPPPWGLSPVTRLSVDGFEKIPAFKDRDEWLAFADWRSAGHLGIRQLAALLAASLPVPQVYARRATEDSMRYVVHRMAYPRGADVVQMSDLQSTILPFLEKCVTPDITNSMTNSSPAKSLSAAQELELALELHIRSLHSLRACSRDWRYAAGVPLALHLCMLFTHPRARSSSRLASTRLKAAAMFKRLGRPGNERALRLMLSTLHDADESTCKFALSALPSIAEVGDPHVMQALVKGSQHSSARCRVLVLSTLEQMAEKNGYEAIECITACLEDADHAVQCTAARALAQTARPGNPRAVSALCVCLSVCTSDVRRVILKTLVKIAERGSQKAIGAVQAHISDSDSDIRLFAVAALGQLAERGDANVVKLLACRLALENESDAHMRCAAMKALAEVAAWGDPYVIKVVSSQLEDGRSYVQQEALRTLAQLVFSGDPTVIRCVANHAMSSDAAVRFVVLQTLTQLAPPGNILAMDVADRLITDEDVLVQLEAGRLRTRLRPPATSSATWAAVCSESSRTQEPHEHQVPRPLPEPALGYSCMEEFVCDDEEPRKALPGSRWRRRHVDIVSATDLFDARPVIAL